MSIDCIGMLPGEVSMEYRGNIMCGAMCMSVTCLKTIQRWARCFFCALDSSSQFVFMARMSVRVFAWTICDSMCGDDEGIYNPGIACMCLTIVWSSYSYLDLRATADERTDLGV